MGWPPIGCSPPRLKVCSERNKPNTEEEFEKKSNEEERKVGDTERDRIRPSLRSSILSLFLSCVCVLLSSRIDSQTVERRIRAPGLSDFHKASRRKLTPVTVLALRSSFDETATLLAVGVAGTTLKARLVATRARSVNASILKPSPVRGTDRPEKVATPSTAFAVSVPPKVTPLGAPSRKMVTLPLYVLTGWPEESSTETLSPKSDPEAITPGG